MDLFVSFESGWMAGFGTALLALGLVLGWRRAELRVRGERVTGELVRWSRERDRSEPWRVYDHPVVRFPGPDGRLIEHRSATGGFPRVWPVGTRLDVRFMTHDPRRAEIAAPPHFWAAPAGVTLFGLALLAAAARVAGSVQTS
jgi:hypothetical protein